MFVTYLHGAQLRVLVGLGGLHTLILLAEASDELHQSIPLALQDLPCSQTHPRFNILLGIGSMGTQGRLAKGRGLQIACFLSMVYRIFRVNSSMELYLKYPTICSGSCSLNAERRL